MADMMDVAAAMMAFQRQAAEQIQACNAALATSGLGFSADDRAVIAASAAAHPYPPGYDPSAQASPEVIAAAQEAAARAAEAEYPRDGFASDDPRLQPVEGISIAHYAVAGRAIGWSTDPAFIERVTAALGMDVAQWERVTAAWTQRITDDIVLAAFYGQLYSKPDWLGAQRLVTADRRAEFAHVDHRREPRRRPDASNRRLRVSMALRRSGGRGRKRSKLAS
ncbi:MAG: DUF6620 family protein [Solirubrobacteraceae bacterium]